MLCLLFADDYTAASVSDAAASEPQPESKEEEEGEEQHGTTAMFNKEDFTATVMPWLEQLADQEKVQSVADVRDPATSARLKAYLESITHQQPVNVFRNVAERILSASSN